MMVFNPNHSMLPLTATQDWDLIISRFSYGFSHTIEHCRTHQPEGNEVVLFHASWAQGEVACPLVVRKSHATIDVATPYGFSGFIGKGDMEQFPAWWRTFAVEQGWTTGYFIINPWLSGPSWKSQDGVLSHNSLFGIDLSLGEDLLYQRLSRSRKRQITRWSHPSIEVVEDKELIRAFISSIAETFYQRVGIKNSARLSQAQWDQLFSSSRIYTVGVKKDGALVAMTVFGEGQEIVDAYFNLSLDNGKDAATYLMWQGVKRYARRGFRVLNMGGGLSPHDNIAEAKRRFGCEEFAFKSVRQVYNPEEFASACLKDNQHANRAIFFPPYLS